MTDAARSLVRLLHGDTSAQIRTVCQAARTTQCISFPLPSTGEYVVDRVLDASFSQDNACNTILQDILPSFFRGSSALLMIAGGPSSGKTYSLVGLPSEEVGILPRLLISIFHQIQQSHPEKAPLRQSKSKHLTAESLSISYALIDHDSDQVRDALHVNSTGAPHSKWPAIAVPDINSSSALELTCMSVTSSDQAMRLLVPPYYSVHLNSNSAACCSSIISLNLQCSSYTLLNHAEVPGPSVTSTLHLIELSPLLMRTQMAGRMALPASLPVTALEIGAWWRMFRARRRQPKSHIDQQLADVRNSSWHSLFARTLIALTAHSLSSERSMSRNQSEVAVLMACVSTNVQDRAWTCSTLQTVEQWLPANAVVEFENSQSDLSLSPSAAFLAAVSPAEPVDDDFVDDSATEWMRRATNSSFEELSGSAAHTRAMIHELDRETWAVRDQLDKATALLQDQKIAEQASKSATQSSASLLSRLRTATEHTTSSAAMGAATSMMFASNQSTLSSRLAAIAPSPASPRLAPVVRSDSLGNLLLNVAQPPSGISSRSESPQLKHNDLQVEIDGLQRRIRSLASQRGFLMQMLRNTHSQLQTMERPQSAESGPVQPERRTVQTQTASSTGLSPLSSANDILMSLAQGIRADTESLYSPLASPSGSARLARAAQVAAANDPLSPLHYLTETQQTPKAVEDAADAAIALRRSALKISIPDATPLPKPAASPTKTPLADTPRRSRLVVNASLPWLSSWQPLNVEQSLLQQVDREIAGLEESLQADQVANAHAGPSIAALLSSSSTVSISPPENASPPVSSPRADAASAQPLALAIEPIDHDQLVLVPSAPTVLSPTSERRSLAVSILSQPRLTVDLTLTDIAQEDDLLERDYQKLDEEEEQIQVPSPKFGPRRARPETPDSIEHTISLRDLDEELRAELKTVLQNAQQEASDLEANPPLEDLETFPELAEFTHTTIQLQRQLASQHAEAAALRDRCAQLHANMAACMKAPAVLQQALQTALTERDEARQQLSVVASDLEEVKSAAITALSQSKGGKLRVDNSSNSNVPSVSATTTLSPTAGPVNADLAPVPAAIALQAPRVLSHRQALITPRGDSRPQTPRITRATTSAVTAAAPSFGRRASISVSLDGAVAVNVQHKRNAEHVQTQTDEDDEIVQLRDKVDELQSALRQQGMDLHEAHAQLSAAASEAVELELLLAATRQQQSEALVVQQRLVMAKFGLQKKLVTELRAVCQRQRKRLLLVLADAHRMQRAAIVEAVEDRQVSLMELEQRLGSAAEQERQQWHHDVEQLETQLRESEADRLLNGNRVGRLEREVEKLQNQLNAEKRSVAKQDGMITELRADLAAVTSNFKAAQARHTERDSAQASSKEKYHNRLNEYQTQVSSLLEQLAASVAQSEKHRTLSADLQLQLDSLKGEQHEMLRWETERARAKAARSPSAALRVIVSPPVDKPISPRNKIDSASQQVGTSPVKFISDAPPAASSAAAPIEPQALISVPRRLTPPALVPADSEPVPESPAAAQFPSEQSLSAAHSPSEPSAHASLSLSDSVSTPNLPSHYDEQFAEQVRSPATANESHSPMSIQNSSSAPSLRSLELPKSKPNLSLQSIAEHPSTPPEEVPAAPALQQVAPAAKDAPDSRMFGAVRQRIHEQRRAVSMSPEHDQSLAVSDARPVDNKFNRSLLSALEHSPLPSRDPSPELLSQAAKSEPVVEELPPRELPAQNERLNKSVSALIPVQLVRDQQSPPSIVKHVHRSRNNVSWIDHKFGTGVHLTTTRHIPARTVRRRTSKVISPGKFVHSPAVSNVSLSIDVDVPDISDLGSPHYSQPSLRPSSPVSILRGGPYPVSQVTPTEHDNSEVPMETAPMPDRNSVRVTSDSPSRKNAPAVYCSVSAPLLQYPNGYVRLSPTERQALSSLCKLNTNELLRLQQIFSCNQVGGLISERLFWNVVSLGSPIIALRAPWGAVHKQMFGVFDQLRLGALTCFEFVLALCILGERATFLQRVVFSFDAMDINHDQRLDLNELQLVIDSIRPRDGVEFAEACQQLFLPANAVTTDQHMSVVPSSHRIRVPVGADHETGHPVARCAMPPEYWMTPFHIEHALTQSFLKGDINQDGVLSREEYLAVIANATEHERRLILSPFSIDLTQLLREPMV